MERVEHGMSNKESLGNYVSRILKEKGLSITDVKERSGGRISEGYICGISKGKVGGLTLGKLLALARGLGVAEEEIVAVAIGTSIKDHNGFRESEFAMLYERYKELSDDDKREVLMLLDMIDREIERRRALKTLSVKTAKRIARRR
jgi:transcriptional regulator with XRE-family HTH domain